MNEPRKYGRGRARPAPMPVEELRLLLAYDRETGVLTWNDCPIGGQGARRMKPGSVAGCVATFGYVVVRIKKVLYPAHRIAWYLETGEWPPEQIDHINEAKGDNRWSNLRLATHAENTHYRHQARIARDPPKPTKELSDPSPTYKTGPITVEALRMTVTYAPDSGRLFWIHTVGCNFNRRPAGSVAGRVTDRGYVIVKINGTLYAAHRLAWVLMTGEWPAGEIDHVNGIKHDNRWVNLRLATRSQNQHAARKRKIGKTGYRGVSANGNGFQAKISINRKLICFPTRATAEEAYADYCAAAMRYHGQFARLS